MSDCEHCWHLSHTLPMNPPTKVSVCCYCGASKRDRPTPAWKDHGPHHPSRGFTTLPKSGGIDDLEIDGSSASELTIGDD